MGFEEAFPSTVGVTWKLKREMERKMSLQTGSRRGWGVSKACGSRADNTSRQKSGSDTTISEGWLSR